MFVSQFGVTLSVLRMHVRNLIHSLAEYVVIFVVSYFFVFDTEILQAFCFSIFYDNCSNDCFFPRLKCLPLSLPNATNRTEFQSLFVFKWFFVWTLCVSKLILSIALSHSLGRTNMDTKCKHSVGRCSAYWRFSWWW